MTIYDHRKKVYDHIVATLAPVKVFALGQAIKIQPPYVQVNIFGLGKERNITCPTRVNGNTILCFGDKRWSTNKLVSEVEDSLSATRADGIYLEDVEWTGSITKYNDSLFAGEVKFTTRS